MSQILQQFVQSLPRHGRVLDLGAGKGKQASRLAELGFAIDAVDRVAPEIEQSGITWHTKTAEAFIESLEETTTYNGMLLRNIIQFLDKEWFLQTALPKLIGSLSDSGTIAIETFWKAPEPPFEKPHASYYTPDEIMQAASGCEKLFSEQVTEEGSDLSGTPRTFNMTRVLLKKKS